MRTSRVGDLARKSTAACFTEVRDVRSHSSISTGVFGAADFNCEKVFSALAADRAVKKICDGACLANANTVC